jgi:hypothetical protein
MTAYDLGLLLAAFVLILGVGGLVSEIIERIIHARRMRHRLHDMAHRP